jgi:hypothetical protein
VHAWTGDGHPVGTLKHRARFWLGPNGSNPITLMRKIIRSVGGECICDLFMGTAATAPPP